MDSIEIAQKWNVKSNLLFDDEEALDSVLRNTPFQFTDDKEFDRLALIYWWMKIYQPGSYKSDKTDYEIYKTYSSAVYHLLKYCRFGGYLVKTGQSGLQVNLNYGCNIEEATNEISLVIPYITECEFENEELKGKYIDIFEHTLSEYGCYHAILADGIYIFGITSYSNWREIERFDSLMNFLKYVSTNHYYQKEEVETE